VPTVRITDEVNEAMKALAKADHSGRSVTQLVDEALRRRAGLVVAGGPTPVARARPATMTRPRARRPQPEQVTSGVKPSQCSHPVGRRIDGVCMECGSKP
jgi:hypothetical protein